MAKIILPILFAAASVISASEFADMIAPNLLQRSAVVGGGWSLALTKCPAEMTTCNYNGCCPSSLECAANGNVLSTFCCPEGTNCLSSIRATPFCADDSWSLWNSTVNDRGSATAGYFCCLPGQKGLQDKSCVVSGTVIVPSLSAQLISAATGVASTPSTSSSLMATTSVMTTMSAAATTSKVATSSPASTSPASTSDGNQLTAGSLVLGLIAIQFAAAALN